MTGVKVGIPNQQIIRPWFIAQIVMVIIMRIYICPRPKFVVPVIVFSTINLLMKNVMVFQVIHWHWKEQWMRNILPINPRLK